MMFVLGKGLENTFTFIKSACDHGSSCQCDHRISSPVLEEGITCDNALALRGFSVYYISICTQNELSADFTGQVCFL